MKVALRDDDLNFFFTPDQIEDRFSEIWDVCPVSMSVIPSVMGNWPVNTALVEKMGVHDLPQEVLDKVASDKQIFNIWENRELVEFLKARLKDKRIYLTIHGIHHRNLDASPPILKKNFGLGAEFYTDRDLYDQLNWSIAKLEEVFGQKIEVFTPPQNMLNRKGFDAVSANGLNICSYLPGLKNFKFMCGSFDKSDVVKILLAKLNVRPQAVMRPLRASGIRVIGHHSIQPATNMDSVYQNFERALQAECDFVISTHSYGFHHQMTTSGATMGEEILKLISFAKKTNRVEFAPLNELF